MFITKIIFFSSTLTNYIFSVKDLVWITKHGRNFTYPEYTVKYPRQPKYKLNHVVAKLWIHIFEKSLDGEVELHITPIVEDLVSVEIDAVDMTIKNVLVNGENAKYVYDGEKLTVINDSKFEKNKQYVITVNYHTKPRKGLHFILPNKAHPDRLPQVWSQGESEDTRYWLPIYDYPNNKTTWEFIVYVPKGYTVISNGELVNQSENEEYSIWHWKMDTPQSTYLIALVVGIFDMEKEYFEDIPLYYYVPKGMGVHIKRSFSRTSDILKFFSEYTGVKYPYKSYTQVCVHEFIAGGMENTTLTILTDWTLHDEKAHEDFESEPLVAHEAAHQWFGDLVTMKDWGNIWLNESFATYMENLYLRHWKGEDEFIYAMYSDLKLYLMEYATRYSRPIVTRVYKYPDEVFDLHSYPKGGLVLHTLSNMIGEENFRKAINLYLERFKFSNADTEDLRKIFEEVTNLDLEWFFDQYVYNAGHPVLKVQQRWNPEDKVLTVTITQSQRDDSLEVYRLPLEIVVIKGENRITKKVMINEKTYKLQIPMEEAPDLVLIDPRLKTFAVVELEYSMEDLLRIIKNSPYIYPKLLALEKITKHRSSRVVQTLKETLQDRNEFWGVRAKAAEALGALNLTEAMEVLIESIEKVQHKKVRRAIAQALGNYRDAKVIDVLKKVLEDKEESYYVRQAAAISLGKTKFPDVLNILLKEINTPSHNYVITRGVIRGLAELGSDEALDIILKYTDESNPSLVRIEAIASLGMFPKNKKAYDVIKQAIKDEYVRIRSAAVMAIRETMDPEFIPQLNYIMETDIYGSLIRRARDTLTKIQKHMEKGTEYKKLREEIDKIKEENRKILDRITKLEKGLQ